MCAQQSKSRCFLLLVPFSNRHFMFYCCFVQQRNRFAVPRFGSIFLPPPLLVHDCVSASPYVAVSYLLFVLLHFGTRSHSKNYDTGTKTMATTTKQNIAVGKVHVLHILSITCHGACCIWMPKNKQATMTTTMTKQKVIFWIKHSNVHT